MVLKPATSVEAWNALTINNNFLFEKVMRNRRLCKYLIEKILSIKIRKLYYPENEKAIIIGRDIKSIRLDVYVEDDKNRVFDIEMQCTDENHEHHGLAKRVRYYQSTLDMNLLQKGAAYEELKPTYIIFICTFDPFGKNLPMYTFKNCCLEENTLKLNDGSTKIFLNSKGSEKAKDKDIAAFLRYVDGHQPEGHFTQSIDQEVQWIKKQERMREEYMRLEDEFNRREHEGYQKGKLEGKTETAVSMLRDKISLETISRYTQLPIKRIKELQEHL